MPELENPYPVTVKIRPARVARDTGCAERCRHWAHVVGGGIGIVLLVALALVVLVAALPLLLLGGGGKLVWDLCFTTVYEHIYVRHLGWLHLKLMPSSAKMRWDFQELPGVIGEHGEDIRVFAIPYFTDNYAYLIVVDKKEKEKEKRQPLRGVIVDCGDAEKVLDGVICVSEDSFNCRPIDVVAILTTHHHWDHMLGNHEFPSLLHRHHASLEPGEQEFLPRAPVDFDVYSGAMDYVVGTTVDCEHGDVIEPCDGLLLEVIFAPCHTNGHLLFYLRCSEGAQWGGCLNASTAHAPEAEERTAESKEGKAPAHAASLAKPGVGFADSNPSPAPKDAPADVPLGRVPPEGAVYPLRPVVPGNGVLFSGDTLFYGGCGAVFEGGSFDMTRNHATILQKCSLQTLVYSGHEYSHHLMKEELTGARACGKMSSFFYAACHFYRVSHQTQGSHQVYPLVTVGELVPMNEEFRKVYDLGVLVLTAALHALPATALKDDAGPSSEGGAAHEWDATESSKDAVATAPGKEAARRDSATQDPAAQDGKPPGASIPTQTQQEGHHMAVPSPPQARRSSGNSHTYSEPEVPVQTPVPRASASSPLTAPERGVPVPSVNHSEPGTARASQVSLHDILSAQAGAEPGVARALALTEVALGELTAFDATRAEAFLGQHGGELSAVARAALQAHVLQMKMLQSYLPTSLLEQVRLAAGSELEPPLLNRAESPKQSMPATPCLSADETPLSMGLMRVAVDSPSTAHPTLSPGNVSTSQPLLAPQVLSPPGREDGEKDRVSRDIFPTSQADNPAEWKGLMGPGTMGIMMPHGDDDGKGRAPKKRWAACECGGVPESRRNQPLAKHLRSRTAAPGVWEEPISVLLTKDVRRIETKLASGEMSAAAASTKLQELRAAHAASAQHPAFGIYPQEGEAMHEVLQLALLVLGTNPTDCSMPAEPKTALAKLFAKCTCCSPPAADITVSYTRLSRVFSKLDMSMAFPTQRIIDALFEAAAGDDLARYVTRDAAADLRLPLRLLWGELGKGSDYTAPNTDTGRTLHHQKYENQFRGRVESCPICAPKASK
eukprot:TRINITY_DN4213_c0_g1_i1.p1 TRINITY_DN4213_c0_g1~~TRINITY_DN4213_c0_g1_i1.p1  ORF type:complete len:1065 (+),score=177.76 TRINITY_DN4213_c0_g1_i1:120-3314(+)